MRRVESRRQVDQGDRSEGGAVMKDLTVVLQHQPGSLAELGELLADADLNIAGICGFVQGDTGVLHVLAEDTPAARRMLEDAGLDVRSEREVLVFDLEDRPGMLALLARRAAETGVNLDLVYLATNTRLVVGASDVAALLTKRYELADAVEQPPQPRGLRGLLRRVRPAPA
jgi:hypothetical protein